MSDQEAAAEAPVLVEPQPIAQRAQKLLDTLNAIANAATPDEEYANRYSVEALAIEGWLRQAIAAAQQIHDELLVHP